MQNTMEITKRELSNQTGLNKMRTAGSVPGIIYSAGQESVSFSVDYKELERVMRKGCFFNTLCEIEVDGEKFLALPKAVQSHPVTEKVLHLEMHRVTHDNTVDVMVPLYVVGADVSETIKRGGIVQPVVKGLKVRCKAGIIPKAVRLDVTVLPIGATIKVESLHMPEGVKTLYPGNLTILKIAGKNRDKAAATK